MVHLGLGEGEAPRGRNVVAADETALHCGGAKRLRTVHLEIVHFMSCEFYHN